MLVLSLYGSPREGSFSSALHDSFLIPASSAGADVRAVRSAAAHVRPCSACGACADGPLCPFDDDMTALYGLFREADAVVMSAPLFFSSLPGPLKNIIDRTQLLWELARRDPAAIRPKRGALIVTAGSRYRDMFAPVTAQVRHFYRTINCVMDEKDQILVPDTDNYNAVPPVLVEHALARGESFWVSLRGGQPCE